MGKVVYSFTNDSKAINTRGYIITDNPEKSMALIVDKDTVMVLNRVLGRPKKKFIYAKESENFKTEAEAIKFILEEKKRLSKEGWDLYSLGEGIINKAKEKLYIDFEPEIVRSFCKNKRGDLN